MCATGRGDGPLGVWDWDFADNCLVSGSLHPSRGLGWFGTFTVVYAIVHFRPRGWGWSVHCVYRCSPGFVFSARGCTERE